jgi:hypothetical protein
MKLRALPGCPGEGGLISQSGRLRRGLGSRRRERGSPEPHPDSAGHEQTAALACRSGFLPRRSSAGCFRRQSPCHGKTAVSA